MFIVDFILNIDQNLATLVSQYGVWVYAIIFGIIFLETGLVITPFLPGDSLIFAAGALAALPSSSVKFPVIFLVMPIAAILGDACNYAIGHKFGVVLLDRFEGRLIKAEHIEQTNAFFDKHGGKTIILARFVPFVRTFAPFVAGIGQMEYRKFGLFNIAGGLLWTWGFLLLGFFFGNIPVVKENFEVVILGIVFISIVPMLFEGAKALFARHKA